MSILKLKFVQTFYDRLGKRRHYFRRPGYKRMPLPGLVASEEFMLAYQMALAGSETVQIGKSRNAPGTVAHLVAAYFESAHYKHEISEGTRRKWKPIAEGFREEHGEKRIALLQADHIRRMLARFERPHTKKNWLTFIRSLMRFGVSVGMMASDPTVGVKPPRRPKTDGHTCWSEDDIARFRQHHPIGSRARLAFELLLGTGQRRGDIIRMSRGHVRNGLLTIKQQKTGSVVAIPIGAELRVALDATPSGHLTFLVTEAGKPYGNAGFGAWFRRACDAAGLKGLSAHGLRHATGRRLAEAGCTEKQIAAILGHKSLDMVERYTKAADQTHLARAAMRKLAEA
jgi:integrase